MRYIHQQKLYSMIDVSIIIVSYNTKDLLKSCVNSLYQTTPKKLKTEIIVIDNKSSDESTEMIRNEFPRVILIANKENLGFSKANNLGIKKASGRYLLFLNPDTVVQKDTLSEMISFMDNHQNCGASTCKIEIPNGMLDDAAHRAFPTPWNAITHFSGLSKLFRTQKLFTGYSLGWMDPNSIHEIDSCAGAFMLVRHEAGEEVHWWDEDFFWYGEDIDFCYRLKEKGWKIYYVPTVSILHYKGVSGGIKRESKSISTATKETKIRATKARFEAMRLFYKKHYMQKYPSYLTWLVMRGVGIKEWITLRMI